MKRREAIKRFTAFLRDDALPAAEELEKLKDQSRRHLQKLAYTNIVDRFDSTIDHLFLDNCREPKLAEEATAEMQDVMTEASVIKLLLAPDGMDKAIDNKLQLAIRNSILRQRHSAKVAKLFEVFAPAENLRTLPRVNINTGEIFKKVKPTNRRYPYTIAGYADWLYSRRNCIVHGNGKELLSHDSEHLRRVYKCDPRKTVSVKPSSLKNTTMFYLNVIELLLDHVKANVPLAGTAVPPPPPAAAAKP